MALREAGFKPTIVRAGFQRERKTDV